MCNPNNPNGKMFTEEEIKIIVDIAKEKNVHLISDEIYSHFSYDLKYISLSNYIDQYKNIYIMNGFSKAFAMSGMRIGFIATTNKNILNLIEKLQQNITTCTNSIAQYSLIDFDKASLKIKEMVNYYKQNREIVRQSNSSFAKYKPEGGFYYFIDLKEFDINNSVEFSRYLLENHKVAVVPGLAYGDNFGSWIRISICQDKLILKKGVSRINTCIYNYRDRN